VVERFRLHDAAGPAEPSAFLEAARQERKSARLIGRCFLREGDSVFHSYSAYARGLETVGGSYYLLDETALGRQEDWEEPKGNYTNRYTNPAKHWRTTRNSLCEYLVNLQVSLNNQERRRTRSTPLKIMVSPVRFRVSPLKSTCKMQGNDKALVARRGLLLQPYCNRIHERMEFILTAASPCIVGSTWE
jgi:hypothetical protein